VKVFNPLDLVLALCMMILIIGVVCIIARYRDASLPVQFSELNIIALMIVYLETWQVHFCVMQQGGWRHVSICGLFIIIYNTIQFI